MSLTTKDTATSPVVYATYRVEGNRAEYIGPNHSDIVKDEIVLNSVSPKQTSTTYGNRRSSVKDLSTQVVATPSGATETKDMKLELLVSVPVGCGVAAVTERIDRLRELMAQPTFVEDLFIKGRIEQ